MSQKLILIKFSKLYIQELWFLHSAGHPMLVNIFMKFHEDILNGLKVKERTQFCHQNSYLQSSKGHNYKIIYPRVMVLALCTSSNVGLYFYGVSWRYHEWFSSYRADTILSLKLLLNKVQRGITQNIYIQELWFLRSAHRLMLINISMTFHEDILNGFQVTGRTVFVFCSQHSQSLRCITQKIYIKELWFLRTAHRLMLANISMTFHEDILNGFTELHSGRHCILFLAQTFRVDKLNWRFSFHLFEWILLLADAEYY